jgi:hypothetical protein
MEGQKAPVSAGAVEISSAKMTSQMSGGIAKDGAECDICNRLREQINATATRTTTTYQPASITSVTRKSEFSLGAPKVSFERTTEYSASP